MNLSFPSNKSSNRIPRIPRLIILFFLVTAVFAPFIATNLPWRVQSAEGTSWPAFQKNAEFILPDDITVQITYAPISYAAEGYTSLQHRLLPPGSMDPTGVHWLGTDRLGRDVAAGLVHGCRFSLGLSLLVITLAGFFGIFLGAWAGYYENRFLLKLRPGYSIFCITFLLYLFFLSCSGQIGWGTLLLACGFFVLLPQLLPGSGSYSLYIPLDVFLLRLLEVMQSIPGLLLLLVLAAMFKDSSIISLIIILALLRFPSFARYTRGEVLRVKKLDYVTAARISGLSDRKILLEYIMPSVIGPLTVVFVLGISQVVLLESTLSFLGLGVAVEKVTWGTILSQARQYPESWWLAVFPGSLIFILLFCLNSIADKIKVRYDSYD